MTFFDNYSYRTKKIAVLVIVALLVVVVYKRAIQPTLELKAYRTELEEKKRLALLAPHELRLKQQRIKMLNQVLGKENSSIEEVQLKFLKFFDQKAQKLKIYQVSEVLDYEHPDFTIYTHEIVIKGDYLSSLRFIHQLETKFDDAKVVHVFFEYKKMYSIESEALYTYIYLQHNFRKTWE